ncbi:MAG: hypothetical protein U9R02_15280, partial [Thermodesulfobacteriota bacterium]|nr:hypothetical protein [Thermodesulfobacteriota bacterium]
SPSGWSLDSFDSFFDTDSNFYEFAYNTTTILNKGESVSFLVNYELLSAERYDQSSEFDSDSGLLIFGIGKRVALATISYREKLFSRTSSRNTGTPFSDYPSGTISTTHAPEPATCSYSVPG